MGERNGGWVGETETVLKVNKKVEAGSTRIGQTFRIKSLMQDLEGTVLRLRESGLGIERNLDHSQQQGKEDGRSVLYLGPAPSSNMDTKSIRPKEDVVVCLNCIETRTSPVLFFRG